MCMSYTVSHGLYNDGWLVYLFMFIVNHFFGLAIIAYQDLTMFYTITAVQHQSGKKQYMKTHSKVFPI